jgi:hypothetical protein
MSKVSQFDLDTPLRLCDAAVVGFPQGGMTAAGLRREARRGRLVIERVAGKDYTTLGNIKRMRELCRVQQVHRDCGSGQSAETRTVASLTLPLGLSSIEVANSALNANFTTFSERSGS